MVVGDVFRDGVDCVVRARGTKYQRARGVAVAPALSWSEMGQKERKAPDAYCNSSRCNSRSVDSSTPGCRGPNMVFQRPSDAARPGSQSDLLSCGPAGYRRKLRVCRGRHLEELSDVRGSGAGVALLLRKGLDADSDTPPLRPKVKPATGFGDKPLGKMSAGAWTRTSDLGIMRPHRVAETRENLGFSRSDAPVSAADRHKSAIQAQPKNYPPATTSPPPSVSNRSTPLNLSGDAQHRKLGAGRDQLQRHGRKPLVHDISHVERIIHQDERPSGKPLSQNGQQPIPAAV
jgi:hypothetical protein